MAIGQGGFMGAFSRFYFVAFPGSQISSKVANL